MTGTVLYLWALAGALALTEATPAYAQLEPADDGRRRARALADQGADAYARGSFEEAHELFVRAYAIVPAPTIALLEARSLVELGRLVLARAAYERAVRAPLRDDAPAAFRSAVREARAELAGLDGRIPRFRVVVRGNSRDASLRVSIDGRVLPPGSTGTWLRVDPGVHEVRVGEGSAVRSVTFELREGASETVRIDASDTSDPARTAAIIALGTGAAGLALGISTGFLALDAHRDAERRCPDGTCVRGSSGADALARFETHRTLSTIGYVVGAAGLGTGAALLLASSRGSETRVALVSNFRDVRLEGTF